MMQPDNKSIPHGIRIQYVSDLHLEFAKNRQWIAKHPLEVTGDESALQPGYSVFGQP